MALAGMSSTLSMREGEGDYQLLGEGLRKKGREIRKFTLSSHTGRKLDVLIEEDRDSGAIGARVWPSALTLGSYIFNNSDHYRGITCLIEIGSGCGFSGIVSALIWKIPVFLTDDESQISLQMAAESAKLNGVGGLCRTFDLRWGNLDSMKALALSLTEETLLIIGSDLFYEPKNFDSLLMTVSFLLRIGRGSTFITAFHERSSRRNVDHLLEKWGLESRCLSPTDLTGVEHCASTFLAEIRAKSLPPTTSA